MDAKSRMEHAWTLYRSKRFDEALVQYEWLWRNIPAVAPELAGVRVSFMMGYIRDLCRSHAASRLRFRILRDEASQAADRDDDLLSGHRFDWIVLGDLLQEPVDALAWFDQVQPQLADHPDHRALGKFLHRLAPLLIKKGRWQDLGRLRRDPLGELRQAEELRRMALEMHQKYPPQVKAEADQSVRQLFQQQVFELHRSLLSAGRSSEAESVFGEALRVDDDPDSRVRLEVTVAAVPSRAS